VNDAGGREQGTKPVSGGPPVMLVEEPHHGEKDRCKGRDEGKAIATNGKRDLVGSRETEPSLLSSEKNHSKWLQKRAPRVAGTCRVSTLRIVGGEKMAERKGEGGLSERRLSLRKERMPRESLRPRKPHPCRKENDEIQGPEKKLAIREGPDQQGERRGRAFGKNP